MIGSGRACLVSSMSDDREFAVKDPEIRNRLGEVLKHLRSAQSELHNLYIHGVTEDGWDSVENRISKAAVAAQLALDLAGEALMSGPRVEFDDEEEPDPDDEDPNDGG